MSRWMSLVVVVLGGLVAACGFPRPAEVASDASVDASGIDAASPQPPSCVGLGMTCGPNANDSCCDSSVVPGNFGEDNFFRSYDLAHDSNSGDLTSPAMVSDFRLDNYKVTVGRFRAFVNAGRGIQSNPPVSGTGAHVAIAGSGWDAAWNINLAATTSALVARLSCDMTYQTWTDAPGPNEDRPVNCVSWYEALAFCAWDGGYLPTEAEWNYAAAGGTEQRAYPWSSPPGSLQLDDSRASYMVGPDCIGDSMAGCALTDILPVGSRPAGNGRWGQSDLGGDVMEWALDWDGTYPSPCINCANLTAGDTRVMRGGCFNGPSSWLRTASRTVFVDTTPATRANNIGFRCARSP